MIKIARILAFLSNNKTIIKAQNVNFVVFFVILQKNKGILIRKNVKKNENLVVFLVILHKKVKISFKIDKLFLLKDNYKNQSYLLKHKF